MKVHRFALLTAGAGFLLIVAGGLVTSTGSSLAVPDWPLAYGQFFPPMVGSILFEHGHRMIAGAVALMTWALSAWIWIAESRRWVRLLAAAASLGILLQAVLGGITVIYRLPHPVSIAHACLGQTVFCLLVLIAQATAPKFMHQASHVLPSGGRDILPVVAAVAVVVYLQLILGAIVRHTSKGLSVHVLWAAVTSGIILWACYKTLIANLEDGSFRHPAYILLGLLPLQLILGASAWMVRYQMGLGASMWPAALRTGHVACGAAILAVAALWILRIGVQVRSA